MPQKRLSTFIHYYAEKADGPIIELMSGSGRFLIPLLERQYDIDGLDASPYMLHACRESCRHKGLAPILYEQFLDRLELPRKYGLVMIPAGSFCLITDDLQIMDLKADLAVLSACETARGRASAGEGVIGLTWAMFVAGVSSTVVSQWKVESASMRDLMLGFHRQLLATPATVKAPATKAEALRQAALKVMKNPETRHPFYWAGFVLVGDGR